VVLQQVDERGLVWTGALGELGEVLQGGGGLGGGGVSSAQQVRDGAGGLIALQGASGGVDDGLLRREPGGQRIERASAIDAGARGLRGLGGGAGGLLRGRGALRGAARRGRSGGDGGEVL